MWCDHPHLPGPNRRRWLPGRPALPARAHLAAAHTCQGGGAGCLTGPPMPTRVQAAAQAAWQAHPRPACSGGPASQSAPGCRPFLPGRRRWLPGRPAPACQGASGGAGCRPFLPGRTRQQHQPLRLADQSLPPLPAAGRRLCPCLLQPGPPLLPAGCLSCMLPPLSMALEVAAAPSLPVSALNARC